MTRWSRLHNPAWCLFSRYWEVKHVASQYLESPDVCNWFKNKLFCICVGCVTLCWKDMNHTGHSCYIFSWWHFCFYWSFSSLLSEKSSCGALPHCRPPVIHPKSFSFHTPPHNNVFQHKAVQPWDRKNPPEQAAGNQMQYFMGEGGEFDINCTINHIWSVVISFMDVDVITGVAEQHGCIGTLFWFATSMEVHSLTKKEIVF